jgi:quercetin dioxygenase-like cupin family protein
LNGEIEIWIDGKKNILDKSFIAFIPAGVVHGPINIRKITKPMFHFAAGMGKKYTK